MRFLASFPEIVLKYDGRNAILNSPTPPKGQSPPPKKPDMSGLSHGIEFAVTIALFSAIGFWLDGHGLPSPLGLIVGFLAGAVIGMVQLARKVK